MTKEQQKAWNNIKEYILSYAGGESVKDVQIIEELLQKVNQS